MKGLACVVVLTACGGKAAPPAVVENDRPETAADHSEFEHEVTALAAARGAQLRAWGTAELDEHPGADAFAVLATTDNIDYVIETGEGWFLVRASYDGKTSPWHAPEDAAAPPSWEDTGESVIEHQQAWSGGFGRWALAIRGGRVVVLRDAGVQDARDGDEEEEHDYGDAGVDPSTLEAGGWLEIHGPAASSSAL